jgi:hypothetical protein
MLHYNSRHVSSINMPIFRRTNCIITASGIATLCKRMYSTPDESRLQSSYTTILDMFRASTCPSSGGQDILSLHLLSSLSVNGCTESKLLCCLLSSSILYSRLQRVPIADAVIIQFVLLKMGMLMLETCQGLLCNIHIVME